MNSGGPEYMGLQGVVEQGGPVIESALLRVSVVVSVLCQVLVHDTVSDVWISSENLANHVPPVKFRSVPNDCVYPVDLPLLWDAVSVFTRL
jgi:hypothetical protein